MTRSSSAGIWAGCDGESRVRRLALLVWRAVEAQHQVSTRKLVDSAEEQALLEELIDRAKPPDPTGGRRHYLLTTPFRYPPLRHGSRFGTRGERGIWYGAEGVRTVFAEVAYYRFLFLDGTSADLGVVQTALTLFAVRISTAHGIDLTAAPFDRHRRQLSSRASYAETQRLGADMRGAGVAAFRYESARDVAGGVNVGVLDAAAFGRSRPSRLRTWHCTATRERVEMQKQDHFERASHAFPRTDFLVAGVLPSPAP
ncbi:MAG: RES family NAD+ phosphorylase [Gemmatimonadetes bacterium]|nr:RES family NAD+ phosphorylase [Gemmatimonadota bacterium]